MKNALMIFPLLLLSAACSRNSDYQPAPGATGEDIFKTACIECHQVQEGGHYFELDDEMANSAAIANKVREGGFAMPAFPAIEGEALQGLSEYVLAQAKSK